VAASAVIDVFSTIAALIVVSAFVIVCFAPSSKAKVAFFNANSCEVAIAAAGIVASTLSFASNEVLVLPHSAHVYVVIPVTESNCPSSHVSLFGLINL